ncbi:MAG: serine protease [Candidatus Pacearchaeota archaeon]
MKKYEKKLIIILFSLLIILLLLSFISSNEITDSNKKEPIQIPSDQQNKIKFDNSGKVISADIRINSESQTEIVLGGKKFYVPVGSQILINENEKNIINIRVPKGSKIQKDPKINNSIDNKVIRYVSIDGEVTLPNGRKFIGTISHDGKNYFLEKGNEVIIDNVKIKNLFNSVKNVNERINIYFKEDKFEDNYVYFGDKVLKTGSFNSKDGNPIEFLPGNPYINVNKNSHLSIIPFSNSNLILENGKLVQIGGGVVQQDYSTYWINNKGELLYKKGIYITGFDKNILKDSTQVPLEYLPFKSEGKPVSPNTQKLIFDDKTGFKVVNMDSSDDIGRIRRNLPSVDSNGASVNPTPDKPSEPPKFNIEGGPQANAVSSTVRIKGRDPQGMSVGTGTIIGIKGDSAYVLTAGHLFRENSGRYPLQIDVFDSNSNQVKSITGQLINYDLKNDIALVRIPVFEGITTAKVAGKDYVPKVGEGIFSVGCTFGQNPSCSSGNIVSIDRYSNFPNIETKEIPGAEQGRSGGGLFNSEGKLIGVLSAKDPVEREGLYGSLKLIHDYLDRLGLFDLYKLILSLTILHR